MLHSTPPRAFEALSPAFTANSAAAAVAGGIVLGTISMTKLRVNGSILGISGIVGGLTKPKV